MEECCTASDSSVSTKDLFKAYEYWYDTNSEYKQHQQQSSLTLELKSKGFNLRTGGGRKTLLDGYQLIEEVVVFEEEDDF